MPPLLSDLQYPGNRCVAVYCMYVYVGVLYAWVCLCTLCMCVCKLCCCECVCVGRELAHSISKLKYASSLVCSVSVVLRSFIWVPTKLVLVGFGDGVDAGILESRVFDAARYHFTETDCPKTGHTHTYTHTLTHRHTEVHTHTRPQTAICSLCPSSDILIHSHSVLRHTQRDTRRHAQHTYIQMQMFS